MCLQILKLVFSLKARGGAVVQGAQMDASQVVKAMNDMWGDMMDKYYDHVSKTYVEFLAKEYSMDAGELLEKIAPLKAKILAKAKAVATGGQQTAPRNAPVPAATGGKYSSMPRKQLVELCKANSLPVKRKNQDMIDALEALEAPKENPPAKGMPSELVAEEIDE